MDGVGVPHIQADVELIGTNASKLLEPREVVNSHGDGPYAIRHYALLVWVINGPHQGYSDKWSGYPTATINRISRENLEE